jgi:16S rRNA (cytosine1402-N4)-methyltransferase
MQYLHQPVLLEEVIKNLAIKEDGIYIDATFGRGGHAKAILQRLGSKGKLFAIDKDPEAIAYAEQDPVFKDERFYIQQGSFVMLKVLAKQQNIIGKVNGILLDLGVSSPQLENAKRGFSFLKEGPLDMRMDPTQGISATQWLSKAKEDDIAKVLKEYGEERFARRIASAIVSERRLRPITSTTQLAAIVTKANPKWEKHKHPATRTFQAIRIFINKELENLIFLLDQCMEILTSGGRLLVISFHSLEDRIVKQFIQQKAKGGEPLPPTLRIIDKVKPTPAEIAINPRARSAILRIAEKIA